MLLPVIEGDEGVEGRQRCNRVLVVMGEGVGEGRGVTGCWG